MEPYGVLKEFRLQRLLNQEPDKCRLTFLGTLPPAWAHFSSNDSLRSQHNLDPIQAIIRVEKTPFSPDCLEKLFSDDSDALIQTVSLTESTDIYSWLSAWSNPPDNSKPGDLKINIICPATDVHIRKYTHQRHILVQETRESYESIVKPYILSFPPQRTRWVSEILEGRAEQSKILFSSPEFVILPDMKWDLHTTESLYLVAIVRNTILRSLRDLRRDNIDLLRSIRSEAYNIVMERWGLTANQLRLYIHYQPSYYHFHVHILHADYDAGKSMSVGQAHLLEDVIALLEIDSDIFEKLTLTYALGDQHGLYEAMKTAQVA